MVFTNPISSKDIQHSSGSSIGSVDLDRYNNKKNKTSQQADQALQSCITPDSLIVEKFNLNAGYLLLIARIMDEFCMVKSTAMTATGRTDPDVYYQMWEQLDLFENILFCKQQPEKKTQIKEWLEKLLNQIKNVSITSEQGMFVDVESYFNIRRELGSLFETLLNDMEVRGLLTYKAEDPLKAMSRFND
jgi:hypothetical protein